jgi:hypothetical protein
MKTIFNQIWQDFLKIIQPQAAYSWHSFLLIATVSWFVAWLATILDEFPEPTLIQNLIATIGTTFFILAVSWIGVENSWFIFHWLTGGLICFFILGDLPQIALVSWPIISSLLAILADFFDQKLLFKAPDPEIRLKNIILLGSQFLISCWIQTYFMFSQWFQQYPSILSDDFSNSLVMIKIPTLSPQETTGNIILDSLEFELKEILEDQPWTEIEAKIDQQKYQEIFKQIISEQLQSIPDAKFWQFDLTITVVRDGYDLKLTGNWQGIKAKPQAEYYSEKICQLRKIVSRLKIPQMVTSELKCEPSRSFVKENQAN